MRFQNGPLRVLELFAGIGGCAAALGEWARVVGAVDINASALAVYRRNFSHATVCETIESLSSARLASWNADLWWLSPPCHPYTRKGQQRDLDDPRAAALIHIMQCIEQVRPPAVALENVPPFGQSQARARLVEMLDRCGYLVREQTLCPSELGVPNRRRRYYLLASLAALREPVAPIFTPRRLAEFVDRRHDGDRELGLDPAVAQQYAAAIDVVEADDPHAMTSCFTSAYGNSIVRSGSYLRTPHGLRRFALGEVQRLLGFSEHFSWPPEISKRQAWKLLGNSLSLWAVREVLKAIV